MYQTMLLGDLHTVNIHKFIARNYASPCSRTSVEWRHYNLHIAVDVLDIMPDNEKDQLLSNEPLT